MSSGSFASLPVNSRPVRRLERILGPLMKIVLKSPVRGLASKSMLVLRFKGRRSGKRYELIVGYREHDGVIEIVCPRNWWKNLQGDNAAVEMVIRGRTVPGQAEVHRGDATVVEVYRRLMTSSPSTARVYNVKRNADGTVDDASLGAAVRDCTVVLVRPNAG